MPTRRENPTVYIGPRSSIEAMNEESLYKGGELGSRVVVDSKEYQIVQLDSGATSATAVGVVAAGQLAYWKNKASYIVTNDSAQALGAQAVGSANSAFRNNVAGVFKAAVTAGRFCAVQHKGRSDVKAASGGTYVNGNWFVGNTGTAADGTTVDAGTAPTVQPLGKVAGARVAPNAPIDLDLPEVP